jgi:hypothetical protein
MGHASDDDDVVRDRMRSLGRRSASCQNRRFGVLRMILEGAEMRGVGAAMQLGCGR